MKRHGQIIEHIVRLIKRSSKVSDDKAQRLAEKIYADVLVPEVEDERNTWIVLITSAPDMPDPERGLDS